MVLRRVLHGIQRIFMRKPATNKSSTKKSICYQIQNILYEDPLTQNSRDKGTHDQYYGVYPKPFKNDIGIWLSIIIMWVSVWVGGKIANVAVSYLGDFIMDEDDGGDDDDDLDDDSARRSVKISDESLKFTGYTKETDDHDYVDNDNELLNDMEKSLMDSNEIVHLSEQHEDEDDIEVIEIEKDEIEKDQTSIEKNDEEENNSSRKTYYFWNERTK